MRKSLEKYLKFRNVNADELFNKLNIDINKEDYSFEEIEQISYELRIPIRNLFGVVLRKPSKLYNLSSFMKAVEEERVEEVIKSIVNGSVINVAGIFYFGVTPYRINPLNAFSRNQMLKLIELLLKYSEIELARRLSSQSVYYSFTTLYQDKFSKEVLLNYLFGDEYEKGMLLTEYSKEIYNILDDESKKEFEKHMIETYEEINQIHTELIKQGVDIMYEKKSFSYFEEINEEECIYHIYFIDDIYKAFSAKTQDYIQKLLKELNIKIK